MAAPFQYAVSVFSLDVLESHLGFGVNPIGMLKKKAT